MLPSGTLTLSLDPEATSPGRARHIYPLQCTGSQLLVMVCHRHLGVLSSLLPFARVLHQLPRDGNAFSMPSCKPNALLTPGTRCHPPKACNTTSSACLPPAQVKTHTQSAVPPWQIALFLLLAHAASKLPASTWCGMAPAHKRSDFSYKQFKAFKLYQTQEKARDSAPHKNMVNFQKCVWQIHQVTSTECLVFLDFSMHAIKAVGFCQRLSPKLSCTLEMQISTS